MISRRKIFSSLVLASDGVLSYPTQILSTVPKAETELGKVKIRDVKTAVIDIKYSTTLIKVTTDSGLYGLGEAFPKAKVVDLINDYKEFIISEDPLQVKYLYEKNRRLGGLKLYEYDLSQHVYTGRHHSIGTRLHGHQVIPGAGIR